MGKILIIIQLVDSYLTLCQQYVSYIINLKLLLYLHK
jgi:hypothetical protein